MAGIPSLSRGISEEQEKAQVTSDGKMDDKNICSQRVTPNGKGRMGIMLRINRDQKTFLHQHFPGTGIG